MNDYLNEHGGLDHPDFQIRVEYMDNRWLIYVKLSQVDSEFCVETFDLQEAFQDVALRSVEQYIWKSK